MVHPEIANYLKMQKKKVLRGLMWQNFVHIRIESDGEIPRDEFKFLSAKDGKDITGELDLEKDK